jgi:hypothetical protein
MLQGDGVSEPIKAGDLVMVVRKSDLHQCSKPSNGKIGHIFVVHKVAPTRTGYIRCALCDQRFEYNGLIATDLEADRVYQLRRLKRIPPLSELEGEKRDEEIHA